MDNLQNNNDLECTVEWVDKSNNEHKSKVMRIKDIQKLFDNFLVSLKNEMSSVTYGLWMKDLKFIDFKDKLYIAANSQVAKKNITQLFSEIFSKHLNNTFGFSVDYEILNPEEKEQFFSASSPKKEPPKTIQDSNKIALNPNFTFDSYIVGAGNDIVYHACRAVAEKPGERLNPLFIYGGVGLGKTHLLHAIGNYIAKHFPNKKICYNSCENFKNEYIDSIKNGDNYAILDFRAKYRSVDVLIIDDIQYISKQNATQMEFFHTFEDLYQMNKQIIISSDRPPKEIEALHERLTSRFASGFIHEICEPDVETREAIIKACSKEYEIQIGDSIVSYLAQNSDSNIRELKGVLQKLAFISSLEGRHEITFEDIQKAIKTTDKEITESLSADKIIDNVCSYFNISRDDIVGKRRNKEFVEPRMIAVYLIYDLLGMPLKEIGDKLGGRDHTTIGHGRDKIASDIANDNPKIKMFIKDIKQLCKA